jgi:hypothetical protein
MKIIKVHFQNLRNEAHYQFLLLVQKLYGVYQSVSAIVKDLLATFDNLLALEGTLVDAVRASEYTLELAETDRRIDRDIVGINSVVAAALHHFDPAMVEAARHIEIRLKSFRGAIEKKSYEEESAAVKILLADLQSAAYVQQVATLNLGTWVEELTAAQAEFERLFLLRSDQRAERPAERLRDVRKQIEAVYRQIIEHIESYTVLNGDSTTGEFIRHLNDEIAYFNELPPHHAKKDIDQAVVASVPDQTYAGKPVTPLPEATYEDSELVFTRDYEVSYHDNTSPGTAALILHGKGKFGGTKTISFNIIEA